MRSRHKIIMLVVAAICALPSALTAQPKPRLTLDEFFNAVQFRSVRISPDGQSVVIETRRADWKNNRFRTDLWLYRQSGPGGGALVPLTTSGHDSAPKWSPDGAWVAFLSDRAGSEPAVAAGSDEGDDPAEGKKAVEQLYVISPRGGEAVQLTSGKEEIHAFCWAPDSHSIYFATRLPWTKQQEEEYKKEWKDVIQYRDAERGDLISRLEIPPAEAIGKPGAQPALWQLAPIRYRVSGLAASPDGRHLALTTESRSKRLESLQPLSIYLMDLPGGRIRVLSHTRAEYEDIHWSPDSRHVFFAVNDGSVEGPYKDRQPRVYWVDAASGAIERWAAKFSGAVDDYSAGPSGSLLATGRLGSEVHIYSQARPEAEFAEQTGWPGTYQNISAATHSPRLAFVYSTLQKPTEVYLADSASKLGEAQPITSFNKLFTERALPEGKTFQWKADDGVTVEGMLIYPPGEFGAKHLRMLTLIHGGPEDADGNHFEADWYQWSALAATDGWLVFQPNYRGSTGYGDAFTLAIVPHIVSKPGRDILEGIDALVKDGIADPHHLVVGGYSYGGYMTDWLITQTTRFKAAVTGAGAIENACNWGNDDLTFDDAYFLEGPPWAAEKNYNDEAALWQMNKVTTPTHMVAGADDIRVYVGEDYLLDRALFTLGVPETLLIFPGEGHSLDKNPWHGKIKVREELKWIDKYGLN